MARVVEIPIGSYSNSSGPHSHPVVLQNDPPDGINACPNPDNVFLWNAVIFGPENTIWDGGIFKLKMEFTEEYPNTAPKVMFITKIFHPNGKGCKLPTCLRLR